MNLLDNENLNFIIFSFFPYQSDMTGGNIVMHKLSYELANRGCNVYVFVEPEYKHENIHVIESSYIFDNNNTTHIWEPFNFPMAKTISIYPSMSIGNPLNTHHVCRWILYHTAQEIENSWGENDEYFNFGDFKTFKKVDDRKLTIFDYNFEKLYDTKNNDRKGFCHILYKSTPQNSEFLFQKFNSKSIDSFKGENRFDFDYLREEFNKHEYFLTYDKKSFFTTAAAMCGCKAIILEPNGVFEFSENAYTHHREKNLSELPIEFRLKNPIQMFGVAYGLNDISWANETISLAKPFLQDLEKLDQKTVDSFVKFWKEKLNM